jgi:hypothetical protein
METTINMTMPTTAPKHRGIKVLNEKERQTILRAVHAIGEATVGDILACAEAAGEPIDDAGILDSICDGFRWQLGMVTHVRVEEPLLTKWEAIPYASRMRFLKQHVSFL